MIAAILMPLAMQAALPQPSATPPRTTAQARLDDCLILAASDATSALAEAASWQEGNSGTELSYALQCQGQAMVFLLRWDAAANAFIAARDARPDYAHSARARLGTMAGNALLASGDPEGALATLDAAREDALAASDGAMAGGIDVDRSRALVALERLPDAAETLERARQAAPQNPQGWLLSATLARSQGDMPRADSWIGTALALDPSNLDVLLEAGLVSALLGRDDRAREYWRAIGSLDSASPQAATARDYLAQLDGLQ